MSTQSQKQKSDTQALGYYSTTLALDNVTEIDVHVDVIYDDGWYVATASYEGIAESTECRVEDSDNINTYNTSNLESLAVDCLNLTLHGYLQDRAADLSPEATKKLITLGHKATTLAWALKPDEVDFLVTNNPLLSVQKLAKVFTFTQKQIDTIADAGYIDYLLR